MLLVSPFLVCRPVSLTQPVSFWGWLFELPMSHHQHFGIFSEPFNYNISSAPSSSTGNYFNDHGPLGPNFGAMPIVSQIQMVPESPGPLTPYALPLAQLREFQDSDGRVPSESREPRLYHLYIPCQGGPEIVRKRETVSVCPAGSTCQCVSPSFICIWHNSLIDADPLTCPRA